MDLDVSLRDYIIIIKLSIHLSIQFKKKKKTPKFDFKIPKNPPPFSFDPNNSNDPKNSRLFPAHKLSLVFHFTYSPHSPIFVSSPPRPPSLRGDLFATDARIWIHTAHSSIIMHCYCPERHEEVCALNASGGDRHECHDRDEQWALPMTGSLHTQPKNFLACFQVINPDDPFG